jgi:hypothetical protein
MKKLKMLSELKESDPFHPAGLPVNAAAERSARLASFAGRGDHVRGSQNTRRLVSAAIVVSTYCGLAAGSNFPLANLAPYYLQVVGAYPGEIQLYGNSQPYLVPFKYQPNSRIVGGAADPPPWRETTYPVMGRLVNFFYNDPNDVTRGYYMQTYHDGICSRGGTPTIPRAPTDGQTATFVRRYADLSTHQLPAQYNDCSDFSVVRPILFEVTDAVTFGAPVRRLALDGAQYDASPMRLRRNGLAWESFFWAYRMGMVARESDWVAFDSAGAATLREQFNVPVPQDDFELSTLPSPWVEDDVTEYVNRADFPNQPGGQFFYAVLAADKTLLDSLPQWQRTGKSFKSGGYVSVCRFYGGKNGGPNTHFYSADDKECAALKAIPQLSYEGQTFAVNMPMPAKNAAQAVPGALRDCPVDSKPLYRVYNNASASSGRFVSNHRYLTERTDVTAAVAQGWVDEGHVMCVPL